MDRDQRQAAVDDLLECCRDLGRVLRAGLALKPILLGALPDAEDVAVRLPVALETVVARELEALRKKMGIQPTPNATSLTALALFQGDLETKNEKLELLSLIWAYYIDGLGKEEHLRGVYHRSKREVERRIELGRVEVANLVARQELIAVFPRSNPIPPHQQPIATAPAPYVDPLQVRQLASRRKMIEIVRFDWIKGVLENELAGATLIELDMRSTPEAVAQPWEDLVQESSQAARPLPPGTRMLDVFDTVNSELLIVGVPGAGKTTVLLQLTQDLLTRAEQDPVQPIPVIFTLASWAVNRPSLDVWLVDEFSLRYGIAPELSRTWLAHDQVILLLDGLDEVKPEHQAACLEAINAYRREHGLTGLVVCSRSADYTALPVKLEARGAVELQPLTAAQIDGYLTQMDTDPADARALLHSDNELLGLVRTPLLLSILAVVSEGKSLTTLPGNASPDEYRRLLFAAYTERMFTRRGKDTRYARQQVVHWLAWLAHQMRDHDPSRFLVEHLQPDWLPDESQQRRYMHLVGMMRGVLVGVGCGIVVADMLPLFAMLVGWPMRADMLRPALMLTSDLVGGLIFGLVFAIIGWRAVPQTIKDKEMIYVVEKLRWSRSTTRRALALGVSTGATLGLVTGWALSIWIGLLLGSAVGVALALLILAREMQGFEVEEKLTPNQGIRRSALYALGVGWCVGTASGLACGGMTGLLISWPVGLSFGLPFGLAVGLFMFLFFGGEAYLKHYLLRLMLYRHGQMPWHYVRFLNYAADRILLYKVGGAYSFIHQMLLEYYATLASE